MFNSNYTLKLKRGGTEHRSNVLTSLKPHVLILAPLFFVLCIVFVVSKNSSGFFCNIYVSNLEIHRYIQLFPK